MTNQHFTFATWAKRNGFDTARMMTPDGAFVSWLHPATQAAWIMWEPGGYAVAVEVDTLIERLLRTRYADLPAAVGRAALQDVRDAMLRGGLL